MSKNLRAISFFLPQFHPILENDEWWGKGFTEWTNVTKTVPRFKGHYQPHLPADMGFYDLRLNETLVNQAKLAKEHGIDGFCFHHYWFSGKKLLEKPLEIMLELKAPDFPFCLCWANENWTRNWDGQNKKILIEQNYSDEDDVEHFKYLSNYFLDDRYIKVSGKPVLLVYRPEVISNIKERTAKWRMEARKYGFEDIYLIFIESFIRNINPNDFGFDASFAFQPNWNNLPKQIKPPFKDKLLSHLGIGQSPFVKNKIYNYKDFVETQMKLKISKEHKTYLGVTPMWDNSARRKSDAMIFRDSSPEVFGKWLKHIVDEFEPYSSEENFIFLNAWNEWAEGNHLEPCQKWGKKYLEVTKDVFN